MVEEVSSIQVCLSTVRTRTNETLVGTRGGGVYSPQMAAPWTPMPERSACLRAIHNQPAANAQEVAQQIVKGLAP